MGQQESEIPIDRYERAYDSIFKREPTTEPGEIAATPEEVAATRQHIDAFVRKHGPAMPDDTYMYDSLVEPPRPVRTDNAVPSVEMTIPAALIHEIAPDAAAYLKADGEVTFQSSVPVYRYGYGEGKPLPPNPEDIDDADIFDSWWAEGARTECIVRRQPEDGFASMRYFFSADRRRRQFRALYPPDEDVRMFETDIVERNISVDDCRSLQEILRGLEALDPERLAANSTVVPTDLP
jgi:hypothetical protein